MSVNVAILVGNLGKDPEVRFTQSGRPVANFSIATSESWAGQDGNRQERTEWHNIVVWGKQAEMCGQYLAKGRQVYVQGRIQTRSYEDKTGNTRYITEVVAQRVQFLGGAAGNRASQETQEQTFGETASSETFGEAASSFQSPPIDDDIPF